MYLKRFGRWIVSRFFRKKKKIDKVIFHCAATPDADESDERWFNLDIDEIDRWHKARGWKGVGYHFFIKRDGTIQAGRSIGDMGAHTKGENHNIGVCYAGSYIPTKSQVESMRELCDALRDSYGLNVYDWYCHNEFANKDCPGFDRDTLIHLLKGADIDHLL